MIDYYGNKIDWIPEIEEGKSKYQAIVDCIKKDIETEKLIHGQQLPPQRLIANYLGINHGTVTRAYKICEELGILKGVIGKGTFVNSSAGLPVGLLTDSSDNSVINLGMTIPLYEANAYIKNCVKEISEDINYDLILKYTPPEGHIKHRYIAANYLKKYKITAKPEEMIISSGTQNAIAVILLSLFAKSDRIVVDELTYTGLKNVAKHLGVILVPVQGDAKGMIPEELIKTLRREKIKGIYLMPDCHNPCAITMGLERRKELAKIIEEYNLLLLEDATFAFSIAYKTAPISSLIPNNSFYIHGTSKAISPSFRISYIVSPVQYTQTLRQGINNLTWMTSPYTAEIISLLMATKKYSEIIALKQKMLIERNRIFNNVMQECQGVGSETAMFRYLVLDDRLNSAQIENLALKSGVQVFCANRFSAGVNTKRNAIRIAISTPENNDRLRLGLEKVKAIIE